jgi:hypothetical protein
MAWRRWNPRGRKSFAEDECPNAMVNVVVVFEQADPTTRKLVFGFAMSPRQILIPRSCNCPHSIVLQCRQRVPTASPTFTPTAVWGRSAGIDRDTQGRRSPQTACESKAVAGLCGASKQNKATTNRTLHAQSCTALFICRQAAPHRRRWGTGVAEFNQIHVGRHLGWERKLLRRVSRRQHNCRLSWE